MEEVEEEELCGDCGEQICNFPHGCDGRQDTVELHGCPV